MYLLSVRKRIASLSSFTMNIIGSSSSGSVRKPSLDNTAPTSSANDATYKSSAILDENTAGKFVRFSSVAVRDYSVCLGDNPSVSRGTPISLDWDHDDELTYDINIYESERSQKRRTSYDLKIPSLQRIQLLKELGYSRGEINEQMKKTNLDKQRRIYTRRRAEYDEKVKAAFRRIAKSCWALMLVPTLKVRKPKTDNPVSEEDTLASSSTSIRSETLVRQGAC